ncbi:predicted protein, partial [Postia placenta Mad-698-R]
MGRLGQAVHVGPCAAGLCAACRRGPGGRTELGELHLCHGGIVEVAETGSECCEEGCFIGEGCCRSLSPNLDSGKLGKDGSGPGSCVTIEEAKGNLNLQLNGGEGRVNRPVDEQLGDEAVALNDGFSIILEGEKELQHLLAQALAQGLKGDLLALDWVCLTAIWDVDVDEVLRVEGMNLALTGSHNGWGKDGE